MTIGFTKKLLVVGASASVLALGGAPAGFAGEDDGPTANGEQIGSVQNSSSGGSGGGSSNSGSAKGGVQGVQTTLSARRDTTKAVGAVQTGFGGMADTPGGNLLLALLLGVGGVAVLGSAAGLAPLGRRSDG